MQDKYAYITVLSSEDYLKGVLALHNSLMKTKPKYNFYVFIPKSKCEQLVPLISEYQMKYIVADDINVDLEKIDNSDFSHWNNTFFKLKIADLTEFEKIVFLDSDMIILNNIDHLFGYSNMTAVVSGKTLTPEWVMFNSGIMVIEPSDTMFKKLIDCIPNAIERRCAENLPMGDQDVFQECFNDWYKCPELELSEKYNLFWATSYETCKKNKWVSSDLFVVHFAGKKKPWNKIWHDYASDNEYCKKLFKRKEYLKLFLYLCFKNSLHECKCWYCFMKVFVKIKRV